jgi:hypothetical protein
VFSWSQFVAHGASTAPVLVLTALFPLNVVGLYALAYRIVALPTHLVTTGSSQVYYVEAAVLVSQGQGGNLRDQERHIVCQGFAKAMIGGQQGLHGKPDGGNRQ